MQVSRRKAAGGIAGVLLACATVVVVLKYGEQAPSGERGEHVLLDVDSDQGSVLRAYSALQDVHSKWVAAKMRVHKKHLAEEQLKHSIESSDARAAMLRRELEDKMKTLASLYAESKIRRAETREHALAEKVNNLQAEVKELMSERNARYEEPRLIQSELYGLPRRGIQMAAVRTAPDNLVAELTSLEEIQHQLADENKAICSLCAKSEVLRLNRPHVCASCEEPGPGLQGDTDINDLLNDAHNKRHASETSAASAELAGFIGSWQNGAKIRTQRLAAKSEINVAQHSDVLVSKAGHDVGRGIAGDIFGLKRSPLGTYQNENSQTLMQVRNEDKDVSIAPKSKPGPILKVCTLYVTIVSGVA
jgi:hypothetical protein